MKSQNLFSYTLPEITELLMSHGYDRYRGAQIFYWLYNRCVTSFDDMTNLSKSLRLELAQKFSIVHPKIETEQRSLDGTKKFLFTLQDGLQIESVLIPSESDEAGYRKRLTLCVSTQVGCPLNCQFCATASMKLKRNCTAGEIAAQYFLIQKRTDLRITNLVYMGMGEPLLNYDNVMKSIEIITHEKTCGVSSNHITISTAGLVDGIKQMADEKRKVKLAISLHSADDNIRSQLMPINKKYNLEAIAEAAGYYYRVAKHRITYEYILFDGLNDTDEAMRKLVKFIRRTPSKVNLIPFHSIDSVFPNGTPLDLKATPQKRFDEFVQMLRHHNITVMVRSSSGKDIDAACGQLALKVRRKEGQGIKIQNPESRIQKTGKSNYDVYIR